MSGGRGGRGERGREIGGEGEVEGIYGTCTCKQKYRMCSDIIYHCMDITTTCPSIELCIYCVYTCIYYRLYYIKYPPLLLNVNEHN